MLSNNWYLVSSFTISSCATYTLWCYLLHSCTILCFVMLWTLQDYMGPYGTIQDPMWLYGTILDHTGPYETITDHTKPYGTIQDYTGQYGTILDVTGQYRTKRYNMGPYGTIWLESTRKYIPISWMSPNHVQSGRSPGFIFKEMHKSFCVLSMKGSVPRICKNIFKKVFQKNRNFRLKIDYNSGCNIKYTWLLKVEYLHNGSTDLYEILNFSSWDSYWLPKLFS